MLNIEWTDMFPTSVAHFMPEGLFDHSPIVVDVYPQLDIGRKPFKYFHMWSSSEKFNDIIDECWNSRTIGTPMYVVVHIMKVIKVVLKKLKKEGFDEIHCQDLDVFKNCTDMQSRHHDCPSDLDLVQKEREAGIIYKKIHSQYISFLAQEAKLAWCSGGDENTAIFHQFIKARRFHNTIYAVNDVDGNWQDNVQEVNAAFLRYYQYMLGNTLQGRILVKRCIIEKGPMVSPKNVSILEASFSEEEMRKAIFSIPGDKAPGPDGFGAHFSKDVWSIIGHDVTNVILNFFTTGKLLTEINSTILTLIPKVSYRSSVVEFRPIAYCNVIFKCITKVLCNRLRMVLPDTIVENQGAFVHNIYIIHNVMICQDIVRFYGRRSVKPSCLMKLDMKKAYDTIDGEFLQERMVELRFPAKFTQSVMTCVKTPRFTLMINGSFHGYFESKRGLRQGDPISPLLFVICMEYLSKIMMKMCDFEAFKFHPRCKSLKLTHLAFVDDVILCRGGDFQSIYVMLQAFKLFSQSSRLCIIEKKYDFYTANVSGEIIRE